MENRCPNIKENYLLGKERIHLYTMMKPVILASLFNITTYPKYEDWTMAFNPKLIDYVFIDDRLDNVWIDDIMPTSQIRELFIRWYINSLIANYLNQSILNTIPEEDHIEFFKLLKKEIRDSHFISSSVIDHSYDSSKVGNRLKNIFESADNICRVRNSLL